MKKVASGTYKDFFEALANVQNKSGRHLFTYKSVSEYFMMYRFIFNKSRKIKIYSTNLDLFTNVGKNLLFQELKGEAEGIYQLFIKEFRYMLSVRNADIEIITDVLDDNFIDNVMPDMKDIFRSYLDNGHLKIRKTKSNMSIVKDMNHFTVCEDIKFVYFDQKCDEFQMCIIGDDKLLTSAIEVFNGFFRLAEQESENSNNVG